MIIKNRRGVALAATLILLMMLAMLLTGMLLLTTSNLNLTTTRHENTQALYIAEAGVNRFIYEWKKNPSIDPMTLKNQINGGTISNTIGGDSFKIDVTSVASGTYDVTSTGTVAAGTTHKSARAIKIRIVTTSGNGIWDHVIVSPNSDYYYGTYPDDQVTQIDHPPMDPPPANMTQIPQPDWNYYKNIPGVQVMTAAEFDDLIKHHGVLYGMYYVIGSVDFPKHVTLYGSLFVEGAVFMQAEGVIEIVPPETSSGYYYPGLMASGSISMLSSKVLIKGIVWAGGAVALGGNSEINGQLIANGPVALSGNAVVQYGATLSDGTYYDPGANPPPGFSTVTGVGGVTSIDVKAHSWREVPAL